MTTGSSETGFHDLQAALPDRYRLLREIGRGGMAVVYLADDLEHQRRVAIKVMSGELGASLDGARFLREIQIAGELSHPNILPAYESGSGGGFLYYVMPFVEGDSVRARLDKEGQLDIDEALRITAEVCDALAFAHERGIVHRDIKPENILLQDGRAVVADFGIARLTADGAGHTLTKTGLAIGTAQYMSPEQAAAQKVDGRSDEYAVACVLCEMLIGEPPFTGPNAMAVMARAVSQPAPSMRVVRATVPESVEWAVLRALEKTPADRFPTIAEFRTALLGGEGPGSPYRTARGYTSVYGARRPPVAWWRRPAVLAAGAAVVLAGLGIAGWETLRARRLAAAADGDARRVAVLYFADDSRDGSLRYIADGVTESLIDELDRVPTLDVASRNAVRPYRGLDTRPDSIHAALGVGTIVRGEVAPGAKMPQVTVRLIDGVSGAEIRNARFDFDTSNVLAARADVTRRVAEFLRTEVGLDVRLKESRMRASSPQAWTRVQRAEKRIKDADSLVAARAVAPALAALDEADHELDAAAQLDPAWAQPLVSRAASALSRAHALSAQPALVNAVLDSGRTFAAKALAIDPRSADAHELAGALAYAHVELRSIPEGKEWDAALDRAEQELREAVRLNPQQATAFERLSNVGYKQKRVPEALQAAMNAYAADAYLLNARGILNRLFWGNFDTENFPEAAKWCAEGHKRFPHDIPFVQCSLYLMMAKGGTPDPDLAWRMADTIRALAPAATRPYEDHLARTLVGGVLGKAGLRDSANRVLVAARAGRDVDPSQEIIGREIMMRLMYGDFDTAITRLGDYLVLHPDHRKGLANQTAWYYRNPKVQDDPRFQKLIAGAR